MKLGFTRVLVVAALAASGLVGASAPAATAFSYPGYVTSYYMNTVNTSTLYDLGCALGTARSGGSAPQDSVVFLDYGQAQLRSGVYGTYDFGGAYRTVTQIRAAGVAFAHGFWVCTASNLAAKVSVALGTNNYADFCKTCGMTDSEIAAFGTAWANMITGANSDISSGGYASQATAVGGVDIEPSWGTTTTARSWASHYNSAASSVYYDNGSADGCPQSGTVKAAGPCNNGWHQNDEYYVGWQLSYAWSVPEIYIDAQAKEWQQISKWATLNALSKISFAGAMSTTTGYSPSSAWTDLVNRSAADAATALSSLRWAAKIQYH
jgi:hypothetical protein